MSEAVSSFHTPLARLSEAMGAMPPMIYECHDVAQVGWEGKPDPEQWAVVKWMAENVRPEVLAHAAWNRLRAAGLVQIGPAGEITLLSLDVKQAMRREAEEARKAARKTQSNESRGHRMARWLVDFRQAHPGRWPTAGELIEHVLKRGLRGSLSRMTFNRYKAAALEEGYITATREWRHVRIQPGPNLPAEFRTRLGLDLVAVTPAGEDDPAI